MLQQICVVIFFCLFLSLSFWSESLLAVPNCTVPPQGPVGSMSHWENSPAPVRKMLTSDEMVPLRWEVPVSASATAMSHWGCPKACELKLFSSNAKVEREGDLAAAENVNFAFGGWEKLKKKRKTAYSKDHSEEFNIVGSKVGSCCPELGGLPQVLCGLSPPPPAELQA